MTQFKNAVDELINDLVDSGFINDVIDFGTKLINGLDSLVNTFGGLGSTLLAIGLIVGGKKGLFTDFIKNIPVLIEGFKQFSNSGIKLNEVMSILGKTFKNTKGEAVAFSTALSTTGLGIAIAGVTLVISYLSKVVSNIKQSQQAVRDFAKETKSLNESLDDYAKRIGQVYEVLNNEYSTTEEIINAKNELTKIQNELNESYGNYNDILKDTNATIKEQNVLLINNALDKNKEVIDKAKENAGNVWSVGGIITNAVGTEYDNALEFLNEEVRFRSDDITDKSDLIEYAKLRDNLLGDIFTQDASGALYFDNSLDKRDILQRIQEAERTLGNMDSLVANELLEDLKEYEETFSTGIENYSDIMDAIGQDITSTKYADDYNNAMEKYFEYLQTGTDESREELVASVDKLWKDAAAESNTASQYWINSFFKDYKDNINQDVLESAWKEMQSGTTHALTRDRNSMDALSIYSNWLTSQNVASDEILRYIQGGGNVSLSDEQKEYIEAIRGIFTQYGIDFNNGINKLVEEGLLYDTNTADLRKEIASAKQLAASSGLMTEEQFDELGINTLEELDAWKKIRDAAKDATDAARMYYLETSNIGETTDPSEILSNMQEQYKPAFDALAESYRAIWSTEGFDISKVTSEQINAVNTQLVAFNDKLKETGLDGISDDLIDDFILKLSEVDVIDEETFGTDKAAEVQQAYDDVATAIVNNLAPAIGQASGATAELIQKQLTELGVTNAEEVVLSRLGYTAETYAKAKEAAAEANIDLDAEISSLDREQIALIANNEALMEYYRGRLLAGSIDVNTEDDVNALLNMCDALDIAKIGTLELAKVQKDLAYANSLMAQGIRQNSLAMQQDATRIINDTISAIQNAGKEAGVKWESLQYDANAIPGSSSTSSAPSPQDFDWIERVIKKIQRAVTNLGKVADATYKKWEERLGGVTGKYEKLQEEIIIQQQAEQAYLAEANAIGLNEVYASKVRDGLMDIETITDETLKEQIQK